MRTAASTGEGKTGWPPRSAQAAEARKAQVLAELLAPYLHDLSADRPVIPLGWTPENAELGAIVRFELERVSEASGPLRQAVADAGAPGSGDGALQSRRAVVEALTEALLQQDGPRRTLWVVLEAAGGPSQQTDGSRTEPAPAPSRSGRLRRAASGGVLLFISGAVLSVPLIFSDDAEILLLKCFAILVLAALPGWLFLRFIVFRAGTIWTEYVLNLHRLGFDAHHNLPEPPASSGYYRLWYDGGGALLRGAPSVYRQKFETYYGKTIASLTSGTDTALLTDRTLVPVFLSTAVFACGWATVLWRDSIFTPRTPLLTDVLRFGFLGAYSFVLQMMIRRYFQSDLKASAYLSALVRVVTVLILLTVLFWVGLFPTDVSTGWQAGLAFFVGFFPLVGMQLLQKGLSARLRRWVPTLENPYPLSDLIGLNVWYEARLLEEGIEDMQNLVTANLVDVLLHTRVPVGRLVDWIDQAHLYLLLELPPSKQTLKALGKAEKKVSKEIARRETKPEALKPYHEARSDQRQELRQLGVRTATDFESLFHNPEELYHRARSSAVLAVRDEDFVGRLRCTLNRGDGDGPNVAEAILKVLCNSPGLIHVRHWRDMLLTEHHEHRPSADDAENGHSLAGRRAE